MGHFGISYLEVMILFEQWAGHRLLNEKVSRPHVRAHRQISHSSVPVSEELKFEGAFAEVTGFHYASRCLGVA